MKLYLFMCYKNNIHLHVVITKHLLSSYKTDMQISSIKDYGNLV